MTYGIGMPEHDTEGRVVTGEFDNFYVVATYIPNAGKGGNLGRLDYRVENWDMDFRRYLKSLEAAGKAVIWLGDLNVVHEEIDIHNLRGNE